MSKVVTHQNPW